MLRISSYHASFAAIASKLHRELRKTANSFVKFATAYFAHCADMTQSLPLFATYREACIRRSAYLSAITALLWNGYVQEIAKLDQSLYRCAQGAQSYSFLFMLLLVLSACNLRGIRPFFNLQGAVPSVGDTHGEFAAAFFQTTGSRLLPGHHWSLESNGWVFSEIAKDILHAQLSVNIEEYIWEPGRANEQLLSALGRRASGVKCRILADPLGSPDFETQIAPRLRSLGCEARVFRPLTAANLLERNHRKIAVIDGHIAHMGGFGVRDEWLSGKRRRWSPLWRKRLRLIGEWRDDNIRLVGPVVNDVQRAFAQNWQEAGGTLLPASDLPAIPPSGPARVALVSSTAGYLTDGERLMHLLISAARQRIYIANAYFVPDQSLLDRLIEKAQKGIDVRVLVPGRKNDVPIASLGQRQVYRQLLAAGVKIFEYQPVMMHAKTMLIDDRLAVIGSLNLNLLSMNRLEEAVFAIEDVKLAEVLSESFASDLKESRQVKLQVP